MDDSTFAELYDKALQVATKAHEGQTDKAGAPYIEHPKYVADHVEGDAETIVALLHDVVEDTEMTTEDIGEMFPEDISRAVIAITRGENELYADYIARLRNNPIARKVKIEDLKHNMDLSRIPDPDDNDRRRAARYKMYLKLLETEYRYKAFLHIENEKDSNDLRMIDFQWDGYAFHNAMRLIRDAERERLWKAIEVNNNLRDFNATVETQIAALLYCCIEMEQDSAEGIRAVLGEKVLDIYLGMPWNYDIPIEDKTELMEAFMPTASEAQKQIMLAITIAELRDFEKIAYRHGQDYVFSEADDKLRYEAYYGMLINQFDEYEDDEEMHQYYWTLQNLFKDVFVRYYLSKEGTELYQWCDLWCWVWKHYEDGEDEDWVQCSVQDFPPGKYMPLKREEAEAIEDGWADWF